MKVDIYDLEVFPDYFCYTGTDRDTGEKNVFVINELRDDTNQFLDYLSSVKGHIGFNNLAYDGQIIEYIIRKKDLILTLTTKERTALIYDFNKQLIETDQKKGERLPYYKFTIPQLDLYKIWHFDNRAKATSLKALEFHMRFENLEDMPFSDTHKIVTIDDINKVLA